jgi:hypothetical protein
MRKIISINEHLHGQMSVKTSKRLFLQTLGCKFEGYNTEMQIYGQMTMKHLFIIQARDHSYGRQMSLNGCQSLLGVSYYLRFAVEFVTC